MKGKLCSDPAHAQIFLSEPWLEIHSPVDVALEFLCRRPPRSGSGPWRVYLHFVWPGEFGDPIDRGSMGLFYDGQPLGITEQHSSSFWPEGHREAASGPDFCNLVMQRPRYKNLRDALVAALHRDPMRVDITTLVGPDRGLLSTSLRVEFDTDPAELDRKVLERWWRKLVRAEKPQSRPLAWKGSDDPLA